MKLILPRPDDWHVHLRQGDPLNSYAKAHGIAFGRILAMPNTIPPLTEPRQIQEYCHKAEMASPGLRVLGAFRIMANMTADQVKQLADAGIMVGKYYPDGVTTNSQNGIRDWRQIREVIKAMNDYGIILSIHGETPDAEVLDREEKFLPYYKEIRKEFPHLKMILEHVSTAEGVHMIMDDTGPSSATVTVHHLMMSLDDMMGGYFNPHLFCKPVIKTQAHQEAIEDAVLSGNPKFFFGSDSAPHEISQKHSGCCPAGVYSAPMILPALATFFDSAGKLDRLSPFLCDFGRLFYGVEQNTGHISLEKRSWTVPMEADGCIPLMAGQTLGWSVTAKSEGDSI